MTQHETGVGQVVVKRTGESVGQVGYTVRQFYPPGSALLATDATVDLEFMLAAKFQAAREVLTLKLKDGRLMDFYVTTVGLPHTVEITVASWPS